MKYTISLQELINRPIIRNDRPDKWMNKMTDEEIHQWEDEVYETLKEEGVPERYPEFNAAFLAKCIDRDILYSLMEPENEAGKE